MSRKRTVYDRLVSAANLLRYSLTEPVLLRLERWWHAGHNYRRSPEKPLISVYVPTYNRAALLLERAVPSVLDQTYRNLELIVIGDCCTDGTPEAMAEIRDPRLRFFNLPYRKKRYPDDVEIHWLAGPVVAANRALDMVQGRWIARIDDDDTWSLSHLEKLLTFALDGDYEFVSASYKTVRNGKEVVVSGDPSQPGIGGTQTWLYRSYLRFFRYNINCWRKAWNRVNDTDLQDRMQKAGVRMGFLDEVVAYVLPRPGESKVGLQAYLYDRQGKQSHLSFGD